jgi:hypothetical protein
MRNSFLFIDTRLVKMHDLECNPRRDIGILAFIPIRNC